MKSNKSSNIGETFMASKSTKTKKDEGKVVLTWEIPAQLRRTFKAACALQGKRMKDVLTDMMQRYVDEHSTGA